MDNSIKYVNIETLIPGEFQAHLEEKNDNLDNLANSIKQYGIIVPLVTRVKNENQYEIILGNRRFKAAKLAGLKQVPIIVVDADDEKVLEIVISDNVQRKELTPKEEGTLYDKGLEYANNNEEGLSNKLGIPKDRILAKLNLIRKNKRKQEQQNNIDNTNNISNNDNNINNSSINEDIISLSELNQKEEREDVIMNNNENVNTNPVQQPTQQSVQEPTFGERFYPSLEDQPTNMNMSQNISAFPTQEPLIDLTDTTPNNNTQANTNVGMPQNNNMNAATQVVQDIQQEQPQTPNLDALSLNIDGNNSNQQPMNNMAQEPMQMPEQQPMNNMVQEPMQMPEQQTVDKLEQEPVEMPTQDDNTGIVIGEENSQKDVLPVINMIKSLVVNIENLGYKLNISEEENNEVYNINIEIEK
ncbi:MAG: ParB/RepB/Spo0J family partition protein [Bacilli bacterium]|nr:ParB/RepB/Spo0J family partition protein [Bacilli bacterium]